MRVQVIVGAVALAFGCFSGSAEACHGGFGKLFKGGFCHKKAPAPVCAAPIAAPIAVAPSINVAVGVDVVSAPSFAVAEPAPVYAPAPVTYPASQLPSAQFPSAQH